LKIALLDQLDAWKIELNEIPGVDADTPGKRYPGVPGGYRMADSCWWDVALGNRYRRSFLVRHVVPPSFITK
jgi:hypothetical protein